MLYVRDLEKAKHGHGGIPDRQMLTEARKDLDKVLSVRPCLRTHLEMAQVRTLITAERHTVDLQYVSCCVIVIYVSFLRCTTTWAWTRSRRVFWWTRQPLTMHWWVCPMPCSSGSGTVYQTSTCSGDAASCWKRRNRTPQTASNKLWS